MVAWDRLGVVKVVILYLNVISCVQVLYCLFSGYFIIEGQLLCEAHAKQSVQPPGNMRPAGVVYR